MRITGGQARGRSIEGPPGRTARPTASKVRQAFFNICCNNIAAARFLDVFAGSGLMGIEALSRGAGSLVAIEIERELTAAIEANLRRLKLQGEVICGDWNKVAPLLPPQTFHLIFADPPYKAGLGLCVLELVCRHGLLATNGILAIEHGLAADELPEELETLAKWKTKSYGRTHLSFYQIKEL